MTLSPKAVAFDLDGTLYRGRQAVPGAPALVRAMAQHVEIVYLTNSSVRTRSAIARMLGDMGYPDDEWRVYTSAAAAGRYVRERGLHSVAVVGADALHQELRLADVAVLGDSAAADALLIGLDLGWREHARDLCRLPATAPIIACNLDDTFPVEGDVGKAGCGRVVRDVECFLQRTHDVVVGKPSGYMLELVERDLGFAAQDVLVVGDSEDSDVAAARVAGAASVLISIDRCTPSRATEVIRDITELKQLITPG